MAKHKFDGRWNYFEMPHNGTPFPIPGRSMTLAIPDDNGQVDEDHSSHAGFSIDGEVSNATVDLVRKHAANSQRKLTGTVVFDKRCGEVDHIVIAGRFVDEDGEKLTEEKRTEDQQNQGTWIITKP